MVFARGVHTRPVGAAILYTVGHWVIIKQIKSSSIPGESFVGLICLELG
jgi:hypothetical protein